MEPTERTPLNFGAPDSLDVQLEDLRKLMGNRKEEVTKYLQEKFGGLSGLCKRLKTSPTNGMFTWPSFYSFSFMLLYDKKGNWRLFSFQYLSDYTNYEKVFHFSMVKLHRVQTVSQTKCTTVKKTNRNEVTMAPEQVIFCVHVIFLLTDCTVMCVYSEIFYY